MLRKERLILSELRLLFRHGTEVWLGERLPTSDFRHRKEPSADSSQKVVPPSGNDPASPV
jgi:hypothetical protein